MRHQFNTIPGLMEGTARPDYRRCVEISTQASISEMVPPGCLVMLTPIVVGERPGLAYLLCHACGARPAHSLCRTAWAGIGLVGLQFLWLGLWLTPVWVGLKRAGRAA